VVCEKGEENDLLMAGFYPVGEGPRTIATEFVRLKDSKKLAIPVLPFAYDSCGNTFVLNLEQSRFGQIILIVRDEPITPDEIDDFIICDTFSEFLEELNL